ncbi:hypothetical protein [Methanolobus halotolerans]|uniref:Uncharacterized protein n=1 Tax=Methanolobus halotolerans TaxID=2052935 RepID=A0A4E0Q627_9EURY|nr:hypothetical protein [Methanolobus halotolerans]TGC09446.1 hypothetical protein CUN85_06350 [Methanolobus halotolerans]
MPNVPNLTRRKVLALSQFYDYMNQNENTHEIYILNRAKTIENADQLFHLIVDDEGNILKWKGASRIKRFFQDTDYWTPEVKEELHNLIKQLSENPLNNKEIVTQLTDYNGISFPIASTLAFFFSKQSCPIIDVRAVKTLREHGHHAKDRYDWDAYFNICYKLKIELNVSFRELDKALWIYPNVEDYLEKCKVLRELGIASQKE